MITRVLGTFGKIPRRLLIVFFAAGWGILLGYFRTSFCAWLTLALD